MMWRRRGDIVNILQVEKAKWDERREEKALGKDETGKRERIENRMINYPLKNSHHIILIIISSNKRESEFLGAPSTTKSRYCCAFFTHPKSQCEWIDIKTNVHNQVERLLNVTIFLLFPNRENEQVKQEFW